MELWQQWLGAHIAQLKATRPDLTYERIGQWIREDLRTQEALEPTEFMVLVQLEGKIPGKLGIFIGNVYRVYLKTLRE